MSTGGEFAGLRALVTGAGRGLGRAIALELAARGAELMLLGRDAEALEETRAGSSSAHVLVHDLTHGVAGLQLGEIDIVVHSAAAFATYAPLEEVSEHDLDQVLDVGLRAAAHLNHAVLPGMKERGFGRIVHLSSTAARTGAHGQAAYAACKAGLEGLSRSLAVEGGPHGVTSNVLELGLFDTERTRAALTDRARSALERATPVGRSGEVEEAARAVCFLASPASSFLTGAVLPLNGGLGLGLFTPPGSEQGHG